MRRARFTMTFGLASALGMAVACAPLGSGCSVDRSSSSPPSYDDAVGPLVAQRCVACHGLDDGAAPAGGWRASSYLDAIACVGGGRPAVLPASEEAPVLRVLANPTHAPLLSAGERDLLVAWVRAGSPKFRGTVHAPSFVDPRSPESHGRVLRSKRWRPMLDPKDPESCGRCHDGSASRPEGVSSSAPGAPACTTCHQEPEGVLGCNTCHGQGVGERRSQARAYPPRDPCFFPGDAAAATAHAAHVEPSGTHANGVACSTCHPMPGAPVIGGAHGNGALDVRLDPALAGAAATFDADTKACATSCHARAGGARPTPAWADKTPMGCGDCHGSPPPGHRAGACTGCHRESNATGTAFVAPPRLHVDGRVDLGDGSGKCGACHGQGDDPWPSTNAHPAHREPAAALAVPCATCHEVPDTFGPTAPHPRGAPPAVALSGLAVRRATPATYAAGSCRDVYCHGAGLEGTKAATPAWTDTSGNARACGACHGTPPAAPHVASTACALCHRDGAVTPAGPGISPAWARLHVNGDVDRGGN